MYSALLRTAANRAGIHDASMLHVRMNVPEFAFVRYLGMLAQIGIPLAQLNTTTSGNGTSNSSTSPSLLQDITGITGALGSPKVGGTSVGGAPLSGGSSGSGILGLLGML